jgi:hypothetical protein
MGRFPRWDLFLKIVQTLAGIAVPVLIYLLTQRVEESRRTADEASKTEEHQAQKRAAELQAQLVGIQSKQNDALELQVENQQMQIFLSVYPFCISKKEEDLVFATEMLNPLLRLPKGPKEVRQNCLEKATGSSDSNVQQNADIGVANSTPAESLEKPNDTVSLSSKASERILGQKWVVVVANVGSRVEAQNFISNASDRIAKAFPDYKLCAAAISRSGFGIGISPPLQLAEAQHVQAVLNTTQLLGRSDAWLNPSSRVSFQGCSTP